MTGALLLDTHVWLWMLFDELQRIPPRAVDVLREHTERNGLAVSEVSFWELAVKARKGHLHLPPTTREWLKRASRMPGIGIVQIDRNVMVDSAELDAPFRDPADRMLIATSLRYDLTLATADRHIIDYASENKAFSVLDCRA